MTQGSPLPDPAPSTLLERKQRRTRQRIIDAADELFSSKGFDAVSVTDIAARAEVGRSTFFRYFGDKTEVVFAKEQAMIDTVAAARSDASFTAARSLDDAIRQLRPIVLDLCDQAAGDLPAYERHVALVDQHVDLRARDALKTQQIATALGDVLRGRGTVESVAVSAAQIALACYRIGGQRARAAGDLAQEARLAFDEVLALGGE